MRNFSVQVLTTIYLLLITIMAAIPAIRFKSSPATWLRTLHYRFATQPPVSVCGLSTTIRAAANASNVKFLMRNEKK